MTKTIETIQEAKAVWQSALKESIDKVSYNEVRALLKNKKFLFSIPENILTYDGYIKIAAAIQEVRNELVGIKVDIDAHATFLKDSKKDLSTVIPAFVEGKSVQQREAETAKELQVLQVEVTKMSILQTTATNLLDNIDSAIAQLNRQLKASDLGYRTSSIDLMQARDWIGGETKKDIVNIEEQTNEEDIKL